MGVSMSGPSPMKPRSLHSPNSIEGGQNHPRKSLQGSSVLLDPADNEENLNPEEIHQSLRSTANAIQNYSFDPDIKGDKSNNMGITNITIPILRDTIGENKHANGKVKGIVISYQML